jgi:GNAT superfamily N-acetyltransferase
MIYNWPVMEPATYVANAVAMWSHLAPVATRTPHHLRADLPTSTRFVLTEPGAGVVDELLAAAPASSKVTVEDSWGGGADGPAHTTTLRMPLMVRPPGPAATLERPGTRVVRVGDPDELATAERVMVDGFPLRAFQPLTTGAALPRRLLDTPGFDVWLGYRDDRPAVAGYTFDDGYAVGVYWLATLPDHRSTGMGRAVLATALAGRPGRPWTLVATDAGRPLYESLGFETVSTAVWHTRG